MTDSYLVHLPDGTEYGPVDRATLVAWHSEGRLPATALVWPQGAPEWQSVEAVLGGGGAPVAGAATPAARPAPAAHAPASGSSSPRAATPTAARPRATSQPAAKPGAPQAARSTTATPPGATPPGATPHAAAAAPSAGVAAGKPARREDGSDTRPPMPSPFAARRRAQRPALDPATLRKLLWVAVSLAVVLATVLGLFALLRPYVARRWAIAAVKGHALPERHIEDAPTGLVADLPPGWFALRAENPFVSVSGARLYLAQPSLAAYGTVVVDARPRFVGAVDAHLDDLLQQRLARRPGTREESRSDVQLARGRGRLVRTVWQDGARPMVAATVAWADGYQMLTLEAWAPAEAGAEFSVQVEELCRGLRTTGELETRLAQAVDRLALDVPELSPDVLRLLIAESMSRNEGLEGVPSAALLMVSRGLDVLTPTEAEEMRVIYQQVWEPVPELERERMAALLRQIRAGRDVPASDLQLLRQALKAGMLALAPEQRARLQQLSGRAARKALARP